MAADLSYAPKIHKTDGGDALIFESGSIVAAASASVSSPRLSLRARVATANVNAGATLLPALPGYKYRLVDCRALAYGGAAAGVTTVDILGIQSAASVKLVALAQASLTQSALLTAGGAGAAILADGASFVSCDANTPITIGITGSSMTTATGIDVLLGYTIEKV